MPHPQTISVAEVIAFPPLSARAKRAALREDSERGTVLLFTGVRYERLRTQDEKEGGEERPSRRDDEIWS
ncbi:hypothetical protein [Enterovirga aerilata]|uniref:Uncharacterized protein n=1 Tax=Enterovirga aerilata TaxID=2730920 RepID=A0A849IFI3_9HYPH|nr:hypothetical protein [Enterovirga sp. DB1703]NNM72663.1 hypothetical protein [Enterovirga sp. DB1703]